MILEVFCVHDGLIQRLANYHYLIQKILLETALWAGAPQARYGDRVDEWVQGGGESDYYNFNDNKFTSCPATPGR